MSDIEKYKSNTDIKTSEIIDALSGKLIKDVQDAELFETCRAIIAKAYATANYKSPEGDDMLFLIREFLLELKRSFPSVRQEEIKLAIHRGVLKEFGEYMGLSVVTFIYFVREYTESRSRIMALLDFNLMQIPEKTEPTPEEMRAEFIKRLNELFAIFKNGGNIRINEGAFYFDKLYREKIIVFNEDLRAELKERAYEDVINKSKGIKKDQDRKIRFNELIEKGREDTEVLTLAKYFGLITWFEFIVETEANINDLIDG